MNASHEELESHIVLITERPERIKPLASLLRSTCNVRLVPPAADPFLVDSAAPCIVLDVDLLSTHTVHELEPIRQKMHARSLPSVLVIEKDADERDLIEMRSYLERKSLTVRGFGTTTSPTNFLPPVTPVAYYSR